MRITKLELERFKKVQNVPIELSPINIIVGGNNSGKSSVLEGIHFSVVASTESRAANTKTFTQESLPFCPTKEFVNLRHGAPYKNQSNFGYLRVYAISNEDETKEAQCSVKIYRGRNEGNVGCDMTGPASLRQIIANRERPFSIYVPGLSGISQVEEYKTESIVRRGIASGDANLYLRNVIFLIKECDRLEDLQRLMSALFPDIYLGVKFNPKYDLHIHVTVSLTGSYGKQVPLELVGTGVLQALQILSYVVLYRPYILLLDEPDSHLHPDNQGLLAKVMLEIASETDTRIIATTHSRHLLDSLYDESNIVWLKDGEVYQQGVDVGRIPLLMDIGALDSFERLRNGEVEWVFLTEDANIEFFRELAEASGFDKDICAIYSYKSSSNMESALLLADFIGEIAPCSNVIIHRDRDFMTGREVEWVSEKIRSVGAVPFITEESDIEGYFVRPEHIAELLEQDVQDVSDWQDEIARANHNEFVHKFGRKRDEVKILYKNRKESPPETVKLLGAENPLPREKRIGKYMLRKVRAGMHDKFGKTVDVKKQSKFLGSEELRKTLILS